jgi:hypothetical protein
MGDTTARKAKGMKRINPSLLAETAARQQDGFIDREIPAASAPVFG